MSETETPSPWFHHFWPWFIVVLLGISILGSLATVAIAYRYGDVEVLRTSDPTPPAPLLDTSRDERAAGTRDLDEQGTDRALP